MKINILNPTEIIVGRNTNHQDQLITPANLAITNIIVSIEHNPTPLYTLTFSFIVLIF